MKPDDKIPDNITTHIRGVQVSKMKKTREETRMKVGYVVKTLLGKGKIKRTGNCFFPLTEINRKESIHSHSP
jgi:hypothetical protein